MVYEESNYVICSRIPQLIVAQSNPSDCFQTCHGCDGHNGFQSDGTLPSAPNSGGFSGLGHPANPADRTAQETGQAELKTVTADSGHDLRIAAANLTSLLTLCVQ